MSIPSGVTTVVVLSKVSSASDGPSEAASVVTGVPASVGGADAVPVSSPQAEANNAGTATTIPTSRNRLISPPTACILGWGAAGRLSF